LTALAEVFYLAVAEFPHNLRVVVDPDKNKLIHLKYIFWKSFFVVVTDSAFKKSKHHRF